MSLSEEAQSNVVKAVLNLSEEHLKKIIQTTRKDIELKLVNRFKTKISQRILRMSEPQQTIILGECYKTIASDIGTNISSNINIPEKYTTEVNNFIFANYINTG